MPFSVKNIELLLNANTVSIGETIDFATKANADFSGYLSTVSVGTNIVTKLRFEYKQIRLVYQHLLNILIGQLYIHLIVPLFI